MTIAFINASPKNTESTSSILLDELKKLFASECNIKNFQINKPFLSESQIKQLQDFSVWIFSFPLYVDAVPSHLLSCLCQIEKEKIADKHIYALVNCGFYEGVQTRNALAVLENWCIKSGMKWGTGIGFGGGGALGSMKSVPLGKGPKTSLGKAFMKFAKAVLSKSSSENTYISINFPRFLYKLAAEMGWKSAIKKNGGRVKDLDRRL